MKKLILAAGVAALAVLPAKADIVDYAQLLGGVTQSPDLGFDGVDYEMAVGYNVGGGFGWNVAPNFTVGADFFFTSSDYECCETSLESFSAMVAGRYAFPMDGWRPYVGAGLGGVQVHYANAGNDSGSEWAFGYQVEAGLVIPTGEKFDVLIGYRFQDAEDVTIEGADVEYQSHNLSFGLNFPL